MESLVPCPARGATIDGMVRGPRAIQIVVVCVMIVGVIVGLGTAWVGLARSRLLARGVISGHVGTAVRGRVVTDARGSRHPVAPGFATQGRCLSGGRVRLVHQRVGESDSAPAIIFTLGLLLANAWPAPLAHAVLDEGRTTGSRRARRLVLAVAYFTSFVCSGSCRHWRSIPSRPDARCVRPTCSRLQATRGSSPLRHVWVYVLQAAWVFGALALIVWGLVRASAIERRRTAAVQVPAAVALAAAGLAGVYSIPRGLVSNDPIDTALWSVAALALVAVGAGEAAGWLRRRQTRQRVARLALELAAAPAAGELAPALGRELDDPTFEVLYPLDDGRLVDAAGVARVVPADTTRKTTDVRRGGAPVAVLVHRADLAYDAERMADAVDAARLALENERLHAQSQARLIELRESRAQIVSAADAERRRLERDLHDGSQQRLLAFAIDLAIARQQASRTPPPRPRMARWQRSNRRSRRRSRIFVSSRTGSSRDRSRTMASGRRWRSSLSGRRSRWTSLTLPNGRLDRAVEAAAYILVARATGDAAVRRASIDASVGDGRLIVDIGLDIRGEIAGSTLMDLEDRCGAVDGIMDVGVLPDGRTRIRAEIPCVS